MNKVLVGGAAIVVMMALISLIVEKQKENIRSTSYKDATYFIDGSFITLNDGVAEMEVAPDSASKIITRYFGNEATGDLNGDGTADTVFYLTQETGGNGTFYYIVAALSVPKGYFETNTIFLGDRIAPMPTEIKDGIITVNYSTRRSNEPMTTKPSVGVSKKFKVVGTKLIEVK